MVRYNIFTIKGENIMYFQKAIEILGLNRHFTEDELKETYRNLMRKYHPDANIGKSNEELKTLEEKAKEINSAYELLCKNFQSISLDEYIRFLYNELLKYNKKTNININSVYLEDYQHEISIFIQGFAMYADKFKTKQDLDTYFAYTKEAIKAVFEKLCVAYFKQYSIDVKYKRELNYEVSIQDFYEQLKEIKEQFLEQVIGKEILKYQNYKGYEYLKSWIEIAVVHNFRVNVEKMGLEEAISMMHEEAEGLFELYFKILDKFNRIDEMLEKNDGNLSQEFLNKMKQERDKIKMSFQKKSALSDIENQLDQLKEKIEQQIKLKSQAKIVNPFFAKIMAKYYESIQKYQIINNTDKIYSLTKILEMVIQIFNLAKTGKIEFDSLSVLEGLTFDDELIDAGILSNFYYNLNVVNADNIYIKKGVGPSFSIWYVLVKKEGTLFLRYYDKISGVDDVAITEKELLEEYMPLDQFIKDIKLVGEKRKLLGRTIKILYSNGKYVIELNDADKLDIGYDSDFLKLTGYFELPIEYQDKEYVKQKLIEMIQDELNQGMNKSR